MKWLILIHVLSAIIGVGPTFFGHVLLRKKQSYEELKNSLIVSKKLEYFPKIGGTIAVITGFILFYVGNYGSFMQLWLIGSLVLYVLIQITVIFFVTPLAQKLSEWVFHPDHKTVLSLPDEQQRWHLKANRYYWLASTLGIILFVFMILRPA